MDARLATCEVCGNDIDDQAAKCLFCGSKRTPAAIKIEAEQWKEVNLEKGKPLVQDALRRLKSELETARSTNVRALVLIHGYGSSGKGGAIKQAVRRELVLQLGQNNISDIFHGEDFSRHAGATKQLLKRFSSLRDHVQHSNPGITVVVVL